MRKVGLLTGGGDAPGLNGIIESTVRVLNNQGVEVIGICDGFEGVFEGRHKILKSSEMVGAHTLAGTLLGTSNKSRVAGREDEFVQQIEKMGIEGLLFAGGDGTFEALSRVQSRVKLIGVPKTIDNDLQGTDQTFGFDTACAVVAESVDALRATADAHSRVMIVETMGRTAGWIALGGGLAAYSDAILIPERPFDRTELLNFIKQKQKSMRGLLITVSEGCRAAGEEASVAFKVANSPQQERFGGFAQSLARWIEDSTGWESRHVVLGHLQRSRHPTTMDRFLTLSMGVELAKMVKEQAWGQAVIYRDGKIKRAPIVDMMKPARLVPQNHEWVRMAQDLGLFI